jgi:hypothetical protein
VARKAYSRAPSPTPKVNNFPLVLTGLALALVAIGAFFLFGRANNAPAKPVDVAGQPNLVVDRERIDFGKVPMDQMVRAEFELSNTGDQPLQLAGVPQVEVRDGC